MAEIKKISTELQPLDKLLDTSGDAGTSGQILTSTGTGTNWVPAGTPGTGVYLPLTGGTLSGPGNLTIEGTLTGTSATFTVGATVNNMLTITIDDISTGENRGLKLLNEAGTDQQWSITAGTTGISNDDFCIRDSTNNVNALRLSEVTGNATFAGNITTTGNINAGSAKYLRFTSAASNSDAAVLFGNTSGTGGSLTFKRNSDSTTILTLNGNKNAAFTGSITTETGGSVFGGSGGIPIYARSTGTVSYMQFQTSSTGSNGSSDGLTIGVNGSTAYIWNRENTTLNLGTNDTLALALDNSQNATFAGSVGIGKTPSQWILDVDSADAYIGSFDGSGNTGVVLNSNNSTAAQIIGYSNSVSAYNDLDIRSNSTAGSGVYIDGSTSRVGIGTTSPVYKLDVNGGVQAGGKVTYTKSAGSLNTTGFAVAGITALPAGNGFSCGFTFTCFGGSGKYQRLVYGCYNSGGTWNAKKVIDEGTNDLDVVASANGSTITFTFKARSSTQSFTPRVTVEAVGTAINSTYA